jgi:carbon monoxide dehydrogenase subunit G
MPNFDTSVRIHRPIDDVFAFVADPINLSRWNSAVRDVRKTGESTYAMERDLPSGRVENGLEVFVRDEPVEFAIRTTSGPTPFTYRYAFASEGGDTVVRLDAEFTLEGIGSLLGPLAGRAVKRGVDDNLAQLQSILEQSA